MDRATLHRIWGCGMCSCVSTPSKDPWKNKHLLNKTHCVVLFCILHYSLITSGNRRWHSHQFRRHFTLCEVSLSSFLFPLLYLRDVWLCVLITETHACCVAFGASWHRPHFSPTEYLQMRIIRADTEARLGSTCSTLQRGQVPARCSLF